MHGTKPKPANVLEASRAVENLIEVKTAVASVSDKHDIEKLAKALAEFGVKIIATDGTIKHLRAEKVSAELVEISEYTGYPENLNGRLKTLHPKLQAGVLSIKNYHDQALAKVEAEYIQLVVANLYPFSQTVEKSSDFFECIENIDIGGPALLRAAAKNHVCVNAICDPSDYDEFISEMRRYDGKTSLAFRRKCAQKVFELTSRYDTAIAKWFSSNSQ